MHLSLKGGAWRNAQRVHEAECKRQLTWFRNRMQVTFYQIGEAGVKDRILSQIEEFLDD